MAMSDPGAIWEGLAGDPRLDVKNKADVIIARQRNGPIGTVQLQFDPSYGRFRNPEFADYGDRLS
jgi:replicative DNA helicase